MASYAMMMVMVVVMVMILLILMMMINDYDDKPTYKLLSI